MKKKFYILFFVLLSVVRSYAQPFVYPGDAPLTTDFATTAPTVNDDEGDGYKVGSRIWDITADEEYVCLDPTAGAAVWEKTSIDLTSELTVDSSLIPDTDNSYDLGSDSYQWKDLYLSNAIIVKGAFCIPSKVNEVAGISIGQVVYISGATGNKPQVSLADNTLHNKTHVFGIAAETKADGETICIAIAGEISGVNTNGMTEGDRLHMTTGGNWQVAVPTSGAHIHVGRVTKVNASTGIFELIVDQYIHDIRATTDIDVELSTGADDATRKISFQDYSANELGYIDGTGLFEWNGQGLFSELEVESTNGLVIPASNTAAFTRKGDPTTGLFFNVAGPWYEFRRSGSVVAKIKAVADQGDIVSNRNMIVGVGAVGVDYHIAFDGEDNDGVQRWKEDEDYFLFLDDILIQDAEKIYFKDTAIGVYSQANTFLDLFADGAVRIGNSSAGAPTNYSKIEPDGTLEFNGDATIWDDLQVPVSLIRLPAANPPSVAAYKGGQVLSFSSASDNYIYFNAQLPHTYKEGTDIVFHFHWVIPTAGAGGGAENVKWDVTYSWANIDASFPAESSGTVTVDVQDDTADDHMVDNIVTITGTGKTISSMLICSLQRDVSVANDYADVTYLVGIDFHHEIDTAGSRQITTK